MQTVKHALALSLVVTLLLPGCLVFRSFPGAGVVGNNHPHGGPPGQTKDKKGNHGHGR